MSRPFLRPSAAIALALALAACAPPASSPTNPQAAGAGGILNPGAAGPAGKPGKTLFAVYLVGSDLEDDVSPRNGVPDEQELGTTSPKGNGSDDMREMVESLKGLSEAEKANLDVLVGFGGARKQGWKGIKYADSAMLLEDAADNYFGNLPQYLAADAGADMSQGRTFEAFLKQVQARAGQASKVMVTVWDHGRSYGGIGPDTNTGLRLSVPAMREAFEATGFKADILGFDACLMASVEVAAAAKGHFSYLLASPELEPGHGWDYTLNLATFAKQPQADLLTLGKALVDNFIDSPRHRRTNNKTLSFVNLERIGAVTAAMDALGGALRGAIKTDYAQVLSTADDVRAYGGGGRSRKPYSVDLRHFADRLGSALPAAAGQTQALASALTNAVYYSRDDGTQGGVYGLATFALTNLPFYAQKTYSREVASSNGWFDFVDAFMHRGDEDTEPPVVSNEAPATEQGKPGFTMTITDNVGVSSVESWHTAVLSRQPFQIQVVGLEELEAIRPDTYFLPEWDGNALYFEGAGGARELVTYEFNERSTTGDAIFTSDIKWNDQDAVMFMRRNAAGAITSSWVVPVLTKSGDESVLSREQFPIASGDRLVFKHYVMEPENEKEPIKIVLSKPVPAGEAPRFTWAPTEGERSYLAFAEDIKENLANSSLHKVP